MSADLLLVAGAAVAGVLTTLAPCVLPLLPVVVGGSFSAPAPVAAMGVPAGGLLTRSRPRVLSSSRRALVVTGSLGLSVIAFTLLLKVSTALIGLPVETWQVLSGGVLLVLGASQLFPSAWDSVSTGLGLGARAGSLRPVSRNMRQQAAKTRFESTPTRVSSRWGTKVRP